MNTQINTLWYTRCPVPTPLGIAAHLGWIAEEFEPDGIVIKSLQETRDVQLRASHIDHGLPNSFRQGGSIPALWARSEGAATRVIGLTWIDESQIILALPSSGIVRPADLRGRRIGLPRRAGERIDIFRAAALRGFVSALSLAGLTPAEVELIDVSAQRFNQQEQLDLKDYFSNPSSALSRSLYAAEVRALLRGEVDAIYVKGSLGLETAHLIGARVVVDIGFHPDPAIRINNGSPRPVTVDQALIDVRPDLVARFLKRIADVEQWGSKRPTEVLDFLGRETGSTHAWLRLAYGANVHQGLVTSLTPESIAALAHFKDFLLEWDFLQHDFSVDSWVDASLLNQ